MDEGDAVASVLTATVGVGIPEIVSTVAGETVVPVEIADPIDTEVGTVAGNTVEPVKT